MSLFFELFILNQNVLIPRLGLLTNENEKGETEKKKKKIRTRRNGRSEAYDWRR